MEKKSTFSEKLRVNTIVLIASLIGGLLCFGLGFLFNDVLNIAIIGDIMAYLVIIAILILIGTIILRIRIKRAYCGNCGERLHKSDVSAEILEVKKGFNIIDDLFAKFFNTTHSGDYSAHAVVAFEITCSDCGYTRKFTKKIKIGRITQSGRVEEYNVDDRVDKFLTKYLSSKSMK